MKKIIFWQTEKKKVKNLLVLEKGKKEKNVLLLFIVFLFLYIGKKYSTLIFPEYRDDKNNRYV